MPSTAHEIPILVFRAHPELLLQWLGEELRASPFSFDRVEDKSSDLGQLVPMSLRADLVLVFYLGALPVLVLAVEVQRAPDGDKLKSWPAYVGELVFRHGCPCYLVVVAEDETTAEWAGRPNPYFQPSSPFLPLVLAPGQVPVVSTVEQARHSPDAALVSLTVHARGPRGGEVAEAVLKLAEELNKEYKLIVVALLLQQLSAEQRQGLEARIGMDLTEWYRNNENEAIRKSFQRGEQRGQTALLIQILSARLGALEPSIQDLIRSQQDMKILAQWLNEAVMATDAPSAERLLRRIAST